MLSLNYATHAYLTILLTPSSSLLAQPSPVHPDLKYIGPVSLIISQTRSTLASIPKGFSSARYSYIFDPKVNLGALVRGHHHRPSSDRWCSKGRYPRTPNEGKERFGNALNPDPRALLINLSQDQHDF